MVVVQSSPQCHGQGGPRFKSHLIVNFWRFILWIYVSNIAVQTLKSTRVTFVEGADLVWKWIKLMSTITKVNQFTVKHPIIDVNHIYGLRNTIKEMVHIIKKFTQHDQRGPWTILKSREWKNNEVPLTKISNSVYWGRFSLDINNLKWETE